MHIVTDQLQFPEGPIAMSDGSVLLVEIARGTLSRVELDGSIEVVSDVGGGTERRCNRSRRLLFHLQ